VWTIVGWPITSHEKIFNMNKQLFFCFGPAKSGTTFLQRILNLHPEISCPPEHQFDFLADNFKRLLDHYDQERQVVDLRTGGQGTIPISENIQQKLFVCAVNNILWESAKEKRIAGANDNAIINRLEGYNDLFNSPKFIAIFRNPIDTAISAWHHNMKLAEEENNEQHKLIMTQHGGLEGWVRHVTKIFSNGVEAFMDFSAKHENIILVRYEDLINDKKVNLIRIFEFLGASTDEQVLSAVIEESSLDAMKNTSIRKEFFRSGSTNMGKGVISDAIRKEIADIASVGLKQLGYDLAD
jgi:hypothetical protein